MSVSAKDCSLFKRLTQTGSIQQPRSHMLVDIIVLVTDKCKADNLVASAKAPLDLGSNQAHLRIISFSLKGQYILSLSLSLAVMRIIS